MSEFLVLVVLLSAVFLENNFCSMVNNSAHIKIILLTRKTTMWNINYYSPFIISNVNVILLKSPKLLLLQTAINFLFHARLLLEGFLFAVNRVELYSANCFLGKSISDSIVECFCFDILTCLVYCCLLMHFLT